MALRLQNEYGVDFYRYPPIGEEDWNYAFATGKVRVLESQMLDRRVFEDMASAEDFASAAEILAGTEYAVSANAGGEEIEAMLLQRRSEVRKLFTDLIHDQRIVQMIRARDDFANMRLALRRVVTDKPLGLDYSPDGAVPAEEFEQIFEQENYERLPEHLQEAVESAVLGYYEDKDIRQIDYAIDRAEAGWRIRRCRDIECRFGVSMGRIMVDLTNIRTMLRLKAADREDRSLFLPDGFVEVDKFVQGLGHTYDSIAPLFYATPYYEIVDEGVRYLKEQESFLKLERGCEDYLMSFLKTTRVLAAGYQPVMAYLLMKEAEIRSVRMVLIGRKNGLDAQLILDRLGTWMD